MIGKLAEDRHQVTVLGVVIDVNSVHNAVGHRPYLQMEDDEYLGENMLVCGAARQDDLVKSITKGRI